MTQTNAAVRVAGNNWRTASNCEQNGFEVGLFDEVAFHLSCVEDIFLIESHL